MAKLSLGMVFGVFDGLHPGHRHFLTEAKKHCERLVVVVAHPAMVQALKDRTPYYSPEERLEALRSFDAALTLVLGDSSIGQWSALREYRPDIVLLGYDQQRLGAELQKLNILTRVITAHFPTKFKSSILRGKNNA